jgi:hypothetical protein
MLPLGRPAMPVDSILVSAAVVAMFVIFAGVLIWASLGF